MNNNNDRTRYTGMDRRTIHTDQKPTVPGAPAPGKGEPQAVVPVAGKPGGRHSAITDPLLSLQRYKQWVEKMKREFDEKK